jgi:hypothetical protein
MNLTEKDRVEIIANWPRPKRVEFAGRVGQRSWKRDMNDVLWEVFWEMKDEWKEEWDDAPRKGKQ